MVAAMVIVCFTSCLRDSDKDLLRNPIHVHGDFSPKFGVPVGYGSVALNDLLNMLDGSSTGIVDMQADVLTIDFDTTFSGTINTESNKKKSFTPTFKPNFGLKASDTLSYRDTTLVLFDDDLNIFQTLPMPADSLKIWFDSVLLKLNVRINANANINDTLSQHAKLNIDSLIIDYVDNQGHPQTYNGLKTVTLIDNEAILDGAHIDTTINIKDVVNALPQHIKVTVRMRILIESRILQYLNVSDMSFVDFSDLISISSIDYDANVGVRVPFQLKIESIPYSTKIAMSTSNINFDSILSQITSRFGDDMSLGIGADSISLNLLVKNNIPLNLRITADALDENDNVLIANVFDQDILGSLLTDTEPAQSAGPNPNQQPLKFDIQDTATLHTLLNASALQVTIRLQTTDQKRVVVRRQDFIDMRIYLKLASFINVDMPLTNEPLPIFNSINNNSDNE